MRKRRRKGPVYHGIVNEINVRKSASGALIASAFLLATIVVGGIVYTYFSGQQAAPAAAVSTAPAAVPEFQEVKHEAPPANAAVGVAVEAGTTLAKPGDPASISVRTTPGASCKIAVLYNHVPDTDPSLKTQVADDFGSVTWNWNVSPAAAAGMWPINITCERNHKSGFAQAQLEIST